MIIKVLCVFLFVAATCYAAPGANDDTRIEILSGVAIEK